VVTIRLGDKAHEIIAVGDNPQVGGAVPEQGLSNYCTHDPRGDRVRTTHCEYGTATKVDGQAKVVLIDADDAPHRIVVVVATLP
jgi:uncharacterized Zn-binding protein involved in type VI secretion